jgi:DNA-binding CsgD family transcriptional regulator
MTACLDADADQALRLRAYERVHDAVGRLAQLGPVSQVIERAAIDASEATDLGRLLLSRIEDGALVAERLHVRTGHESAGVAPDELRATPLRLEYPLLECELLRRRRAQLVANIDHGQPGRYAFLAILNWQEYVAAPVVVEGRVVGFLHGDQPSGGRPLSHVELDALEQFAAGFALVFERAVLRRRLRDQRREIQRIATWAEVRSSELIDGVIDLSVDSAAEQERHATAPELVAEDGLVTHLTARELDVLKLMATGKTNGDIARTLVVTEGTVKFHVKNVLRKMQAANRADATSRYLRLTLRERPARPR